jgi:hypothetical protein
VADGGAYTREKVGRLFIVGRTGVRDLAAKASRHVIAQYDDALGERARRGSGQRRGCAYAPCGKPLLQLRQLLGVCARADVSRAHALTPRWTVVRSAHGGDDVWTRARVTSR